MLPYPKPRTIMSSLHSLIYIENNSILVKLNVHHLEMFIIT